MASRANKYASLNFNDIYEKKNINPSNNRSSFSGAGKTALLNSRIHGNMLVLSRPAPKPTVPLALVPSLQDPIQLESDFISLRPLGRTGASPVIPQKIDYKDLTPPLSSLSPKTNRFVPPHLRPGFVCREEKQQQEIHQKQQIGRHYGEEGPPRSGGGYERIYGGPSGSGGTRTTSNG